jgi:ABC-2 type transport system permease protein
MTTVSPAGRPAVPLSAADAPMERVSPPQAFWAGFGHTAAEIWRYRELLVNLVRKDLKVKYKASSLGFLWSLLRPMMLLAVYYVAIGKFIGANRFPDFIVFLFSGLVMWFFVSEVVNRAVVSITSNAGLIKKVYFPREVLPLTALGVAFVQFLIMLCVLFGFVALSGHHLEVGKLLLYLPLTIVVMLIFLTAVSLLLAAANVFLRDTQHLIDVLLLLMFYMSPILYSVESVRDTLDKAGPMVTELYLANPIAIIAMGFQEAIYQHGLDHQVPPQSVTYTGDVAGRLLLLGLVSLALVWVSQRLFARAQGDFAQSL